MQPDLYTKEENVWVIVYKSQIAIFNGTTYYSIFLGYFNIKDCPYPCHLFADLSFIAVYLPKQLLQEVLCLSLRFYDIHWICNPYYPWCLESYMFHPAINQSGTMTFP